MKIRTRFAPSPTGYLHVGGARTALFNWLYARRHRGEFLLRIEDTDQVRSEQRFTRDILEGLSWLGIEADSEPIYQSARIERYKQVIRQLIEDGKAYYCYCSRERLDTLREEQTRRRQKPRYDGHCRNLTRAPTKDVKPVVRFKNPLSGSVDIEDRVQGTVSVQNSELDDLVLARSDGTPTYHLCVVVDDIDAAITHIIRGDDHLNNAFRQINIFNALGEKAPVFAHVPLIHGKDGKRLSKRDAASTAGSGPQSAVRQYREDGYLPQALLNYLVRLGWSHGDREIFSVDEMVESFDLDAVHSSAATFDTEKFTWLNHQHIKGSTAGDIGPVLKGYFREHCQDICLDDGPDIAALFEVQKERCRTLRELCGASAFFYSEVDGYDEMAVEKFFMGEAVSILKALQSELKRVEDNWSVAEIHAAIQHIVDDTGLKMGKVVPPLRLAVTGQTVSPPIAATLGLLGAKKSLWRIERAIEYIVGSV